MPTLPRRALIAGALATSLALIAKSAKAGPEDPALAGLEARSGGRLGVHALDVGSGRTFGHRAGERFALCSTFKMLAAAAAVLARVDRGAERLERRVAIAPGDILPHSPVSAAHIGAGMSLEELCAAAVTESDNGATNLILGALGGPGGVAAFARSLGDGVTRLDRWEPALNAATPGDPRDTTSPQAMVADLRALRLADALAPGSREKLTGWLVGCKTGGARLRAGLQAGWRVGDKTGTGEHGATNDIAILWPPEGGPILVAAYYDGSPAPIAMREAVLAEVGRIVAARFRPG